MGIFWSSYKVVLSDTDNYFIIGPGQEFTPNKTNPIYPNTVYTNDSFYLYKKQEPSKQAELKVSDLIMPKTNSEYSLTKRSYPYNLFNAFKPTEYYLYIKDN
jgi:hypothetical protein